MAKSKIKNTIVGLGERIESIDIIRGFALFGVLMVNTFSFALDPMTFGDHCSPRQSPLSFEGFDLLSALFIKFFADGRFYTIFSFLFGFGFYLFMSRAEAKGYYQSKLFKRRLSGLFLFGIFNLFAVWYGDILHTYAITGFFLLFFYRRKAKTMLFLGFSLTFLMMTLFGLFNVDSPIELFKAHQSKDFLIENSSLREVVAIHQNSGYLELFSYRLENEVIYRILNSIFLIPQILGLFLIGAGTAKSGIFNDVKENIKTFKRLFLFSSISTIVLTILMICFGYLDLQLLDVKIANQIHSISSEFAGLSVCFVYVFGLALLSINKKFAVYLSPLASAGRMALTNYLSQCIICALIFYGYGLGLIFKVGPSIVILYSTVLYGLQIILSNMWLKNHKLGPLESLWRLWTYKNIKPTS